jgi:hypothetical protein
MLAVQMITRSDAGMIPDHSDPHNTAIATTSCTGYAPTANPP